MRLYQILFLSILFLFLAASCEKEEDRTPVMAGITNSDMLYYEYNPPLELQLRSDSLEEIKFGIDSIDIDLDGSFDILISQRIYLDWSDNFDRVYLKEDNFPYIGLSLKNDLEVAYKNVPVNVGMGEINNIQMVDTLTYESRIDKIKNWHDSKMDHNSYMGFYNGSIWLWGAPPSFFWNCGIWYSLTNKDIYIGIRKNTDTDYKLGWIKVKVYSRDKFEIMSYSIEK
jgi:hypothetical protein